MKTLRNNIQQVNLLEVEQSGHFDQNSEWVSSFLTAHQHKIGHSVPYVIKIS